MSSNILSCSYCLYDKIYAFNCCLILTGPAVDKAEPRHVRHPAGRLPHRGPGEQRAAALHGVRHRAARALGERGGEEHAGQGDGVREPRLQLRAAQVPDGDPGGSEGDEGGVRPLQQGE